MTAVDATVDIRLVGPADAGLLDRVAEDVFDDAIRPDLLAAYLADPGHAMAIALADGVVVGQARAILNRQPDAPTALFLDNLGVTPAWKRRGVATRLVRALMDWGRDRGCAEVWVPVEADNAEATGFYRSLRFTTRPILYVSGTVG